MTQNSENDTKPLTHNMHWDNIGTRWVILGHKTIYMNLEERQISKQIYSFNNIN